MAAKGEAAAGTLRGVGQALAMLRLLARHDALGVREAARELSVTPTVAQRLLRTLEADGFVERRDDGRAYSLAPYVLELANAYVARHDFASVSRRFLATLQEHSGETVALYALHDGMRLCIDELMSPHPLRMVARIGNIVPIADGATDKVFRAFADKREVERMDARIVEAGEGLSAPSRKDLEEVRRQGWANSFGARVPGSAALSAPVHGRDELYVLSVFGPEDRMVALGLDDLAAALTETGRQLSEALVWFSDRSGTAG